MGTSNEKVFPTCVGMNRFAKNVEPINTSVPHMRGDEPTLVVGSDVKNPCSPHAWG